MVAAPGARNSSDFGEERLSVRIPPSQKGLANEDKWSPRRASKLLTVREHLEQEDFARECRRLQLIAHTRLREVSEVNRQLHGALVKAKQSTGELREGVKVLDKRIRRAREVEIPARDRAVRESESRLLDEQRLTADSVAELGRGLHDREERVEELSETVAQLREAGNQNRLQLKEQSLQVKEQQRAIRVLQRHIQILDGEEEHTPFNSQCPGLSRRNSHGAMSCNSLSLNDLGPVGEEEEKSDRQQNAPERGDGANCTNIGPLMAIDEMAALPGLDLQQLLSPDRPLRKEQESSSRSAERSRGI